MSEISELPSEDIIYCSKCGLQNLENTYKCTRCGFELHGALQPTFIVTDDSTMGGLFPYRNARSLWSYYLGVFSLIPCLGIPLGIGAVILGVSALKYVKIHPGTGGKAHAWVGIILGGCCAVIYTVLIAGLILTNA